MRQKNYHQGQWAEYLNLIFNYKSTAAQLNDFIEGELMNDNRYPNDKRTIKEMEKLYDETDWNSELLDSWLSVEVLNFWECDAS
ncbi:hypothetical protein MHI48_16825 [Paenibacillus sp. FSL H7-0942]|uniref:hypothetical protein n=1 Tax=Paenibacillus sp. FSL H7-0942 TaxID=2921444 RepID=UPI0032541983